MLSKRPTHQQLVERQPEFRKAGAAAWLALKRETSVPAHSAPKVELSSGLRLIYASGFPTLKPGDLRKAMQGCPHPYSRIWTRLSSSPSKPGFLAPKQQTRISSLLSRLCCKDRSRPSNAVLTVKARTSSDLCSHLLVARPFEAATAEATKIRVQTPDFEHINMEIVPKESLPVKKATDKEPAAPAVDSPSDMAAEIHPAIQVDGVTPTVTPIADVEMCFRLESLTSAPFSLQSWVTRWSMSPRSTAATTKHGARFRITVPEDRQRNIIQRLERQSKQTHWRIRQNYRHRRPDQPRPTAPPPPLSRQILAVNVANISNKRPAIRHISSGTPGSGPSQRPAFTSSKFRFTVPGFDVIQHPATGPGRRGIALGIPSCFGGHEHGSAVGTMILAKVPNFTPECLWIVGSVYRLQRIVHSWGHGLTVMQFSGSQITRLSTVHGRRHSSIDHFVCNAPARALLTSPRVDRQTAVADHFVIRTSIRAEAQGQPPVPRAPTISRHHCLEATDRIATSNYWDVLADANAVADNLSLRLSPPATRSNRRLLSGTTKRAILASNTARQAFIAAATHTNPDPVQCNTLRDEWSRLKAAATQLERVDGRKQWVKHADNLDRAVSDGRTDLVFSAARAMSGNSSRSAAVTPLYNSDGIVQYDPTSILRVMQGHYGSLAADTTGHSLDLQYWHDRQPIQVLSNTPTIRNSDILDQDFSWNQIAAALLQMSPRKAPGDDVFASATIPRAWLCASIVSIDKKDGDPLNPGDKRGIALINVGLKLVCKVLQMRIERFVETNNLLSYEQAGFRKREECVGQVVSLVDIIQRRQNAGLNTHVLFIDIRKAFDTVPVGALLWKLQNMGFPRRTLAFLKALYTSSSARARAGSLTIGPIPSTEGCQTGMSIVWTTSSICSSTTFSMVSHPSQSLDYRETRTPSEDSCTQTMWQCLLTLSNHCWLRRLLSSNGPISGKCSLVWPSVASFSFTGHLAPRLDNPLDIRLHGQLVSRVESYKYLGVLIDSKLDHSAWLKQKRSALRAHHFGSSPSAG
ncbi:hypothetical protein BASA83_008922 [Batrachochytrium salamandrivorans]|nr:hypothetical protein BASA83_008922 [Batrachochytrium salamandrivorans]